MINDSIKQNKRCVVRFNEHGDPYEKNLSISNVSVIGIKTKELREKGISNPIIIAGDLSGLKFFNDEYGRETADGAVEKALEVFNSEFHDTNSVTASPSGDEMWAVPDQNEGVEKTIVRISNVIKKLNNINYELPDGTTIGLNARFYIGCKKFADVEKYLKYNPKTREKLQPGSIIVEGKLLGSAKDEIVRPANASNKSIIFNNGLRISNENKVLSELNSLDITELQKIKTEIDKILQTRMTNENIRTDEHNLQNNNAEEWSDDHNLTNDAKSELPTRNANNIGGGRSRSFTR